MTVTVGSKAGYCYGVRRAIEAALEESKTTGALFSAGPIIHNKQVIAELERRGVHAVSSADEVPAGARVIIRAHGLPPQDIKAFADKGCTLIDATCPNVAQIHRIVERESAAGRRVLVIGKHGHPEVLAIAARAGNDVLVVETQQELDEACHILSKIPIAVVVQTTFQRKIYDLFVNKLKNTCHDPLFFDTICKATDERQDEAYRFASKSDAVVVIGDRQSSNTKSLFELCRSVCPRTVQIESADELSSALLDGARSVFVTAGASTPDLIIKEVSSKMSDEIKTNETESFEELLEQSLKTLHTGEKVKGVITQINNTDIHVDLGVKQAGYIPMTELSDDPEFNLADSIHIGDEIEAYVLRVNDVEGLVMLSKKRLDTVKNWERLEQAVESKEPLTGIINDQNKGGVVANVLGIRVFIPASQTGLPRDASFDPLMKTTQKIRITEVNRQRRRVVGSIKALLVEQRREAANKIWETIEVGKKYTGTVKSFTSYGAFVDIGGVDGMVHISELSWNRVKHPSDVLKIGQQVEVYVIALDPEKRKISLGYRLPEDNPWTKFEATYKVGDVAPVKIVKFMPFGAFAEVMPGVDGLIHISQIADRRIGRPDEVLTIGETVDAKIIEIDNEKKKISLSIRALLDPTVETVAEETEENPEA